MARTDERTANDLLRDPAVVSLSLVSFTTTFGIQVVSPAIPNIAAFFGVSEANIGLVMTAYTLPGIVTVPVFGALADVYGRRVVLLPTFLLTCLLGVAVAAADSYLAVLALRLGQGVVVAGIMPLVTTVLGDLYAGRAGSTAQGIRLGTNGLSNVVVPVVAGFLAGVAWNYPFLLYLFGFPVLVGAYLALPETGTQSPSRGLLTELREYLGTIRAAMTDPTIAVLVAGGFFRGFGFIALLTYLPLFAARDLGATSFAIGVILAARGAVRFLVSPFAGHLLRTLSRKQGLLAGLGLMTAGTVLVPLSPSTLWLGAAFGLFGFGDAVLLPIHRDSAAALAADEGRAGVLSGVSLLRKVGTTTAPLVVGGVLAALGFGAVFGLVALVFAAYGLALAVFFRA